MSLLFDIPILSELNEMNIEKDHPFTVNTINAHSYNLMFRDIEFKNSIVDSKYIIADGISIVIAKKIFCKTSVKRNTGFDLFMHFMKLLNIKNGKFLFIGSSEKVLNEINIKNRKMFPNVNCEYYSPPYKKIFTEDEIIFYADIINKYKPDVVWVGMTAPKQEKFATRLKKYIHCPSVIGCIGAVFDYYAKTVSRAPAIVRVVGLEWLYRLYKEPNRLWRRYLFGNPLFLYRMIMNK